MDETMRMPKRLIHLTTLCFLAGTLAAAAASAKPNILFVIADDASPHFGQAYGCAWVKTPNIDRLARNGLVFDNAYTPTAKCTPSRSAILTGRNPWQLEDAANHQSQFPVKFKAFSEALRERLFTELKKQDDPRVLGQGDVFDNYNSPKVGETTQKKEK